MYKCKVITFHRLGIKRIWFVSPVLVVRATRSEIVFSLSSFAPENLVSQTCHSKRWMLTVAFGSAISATGEVERLVFGVLPTAFPFILYGSCLIM